MSYAKYVKMLGLAAVVGASLMAFVGTGTASATVLCQTKTEPCASPLPSGTVVTASLKTGTEAVLEAGFGTVRCKKSSTKVESTSAGGSGKAVTGNTKELKFEECSACFTSATAKTPTTTVNWPGRVEWTSGTNGTLTVEGSEVVVEACGQKCNYGGTVSLAYVGGAPAEAVANTKVKLKEGTSGCTAEPTWKATYTVSSPNPLYVLNG